MFVGVVLVLLDCRHKLFCYTKCILNFEFKARKTVWINAKKILLTVNASDYNNCRKIFIRDNYNLVFIEGLEQQNMILSCDYVATQNRPAVVASWRDYWKRHLAMSIFLSSPSYISYSWGKRFQGFSSNFYNQIYI